MSASNPTKAMAALIPEPITTAHGVLVRPLTLGVYALLERMGSPVLIRREGPPPDVLALLPSLYVMSQPDPGAVLLRWAELEADALAWADTLPPHAIGEIERAATRQVSRMLDVIAPESDAKKKVTMAGSPPSRSGRRNATAGRSPKSSGACPPRRSC